MKRIFGIAGTIEAAATAATAATVALFGLALTACTRVAPAPNPCAAPLPSVMELRTREGAPRLLLRTALGGAYTICDGEEHVLGTLARTASPLTLTIKNAAGDAEATLTAGPGDDPVLTHREAALRLHDENHLLRVLDANGVPLAQIAAMDGRGVTFDPGGRPLLTADRVPGDPERRAIHLHDGAVRDLVTGIHDDRAAAAFALDVLPLLDRLLIARFLDEQ